MSSVQQDIETDTASNDTEDEIRSTTPSSCEISLCGSPACEHVEHPQRGEMVVCEFHARRIKALPKWRFIGINEGSPDDREAIADE